MISVLWLIPVTMLMSSVAFLLGWTSKDQHTLAKLEEWVRRATGPADLRSRERAQEMVLEALFHEDES